MKRYIEVIQEDDSKIFIDDEMIESFECVFIGSERGYQGKLHLVSGKTIFLRKRDNYDVAFA